VREKGQQPGKVVHAVDVASNVGPLYSVAPIAMSNDGSLKVYFLLIQIDSSYVVIAISWVRHMEKFKIGAHQNHQLSQIPL
jgi:hypothetical protein